MRFPKLGKWNFFFLDLRASSSNVNPGMLESVDKVSSGSLESDGCCSCFCACWKTSSSAESDFIIVVVIEASELSCEDVDALLDSGCVLRRGFSLEINEGLLRLDSAAVWFADNDDSLSDDGE